MLGAFITAVSRFQVEAGGSGIGEGEGGGAGWTCLEETLSLVRAPSSVFEAHNWLSCVFCILGVSVPP